MKLLNIQIQPACMITTVDSIAKLCQLNPKWLEQMSQNYYIYGLSESNPDLYYCPIHEILYDDLMACSLPWVMLEYQSMMDEYGHELINRLIPNDPRDILKKLHLTMERSLDHTFGGECCIEIGYIPPYVGSDPSTLPEHILNMLREDFDVTDGPELGHDKYIIRKREDTNGNDAN